MRLSSACATILLAAVPALAGDPATPGHHRDWNDVDEVEIVKVFQLSSYSRLIILPFDKSEVKLPPEDENTYAPTREALAASDIHFVAEFRKKLQERRKSFPVEPGDAPAKLSVTVPVAPAGPSPEAVSPAPMPAEPAVGPDSASPPAANPAPPPPAEPAQATLAGSRELVLRGKLLKLNAGSKAARYFVSFGAGASGAQYALELVDGSTNEVLVRFTHEKRAGTGMFGGNYVDVMTRSIKEVASDVAKSLSVF